MQSGPETPAGTPSPSPFGKYQLLSRVGKGGMADVFLARPKGQRRLVAIKCIRKDLTNQPQFVDMFIREGKLAVDLNHDAIVKTYEIGRVQGVHFICMEYVSGVDLSLIIRRSRSYRTRRMPVPHAVYVATRLSEGLHYAHDLADREGRPLNLVNRDVSPSNIRISFDGEVKLLDFGIAKVTSGLSSEIGVLKGKISHMSPEQVRGLPLDRRSDIFAVGIVLHEMLTGERLFRGSSEFQTMENVRRAEVALPSRANPRVPSELDDIVVRCLQRDPQDRFQTAEEVAQALRQVLTRYNFRRSEMRDLIRELCREEWEREERALVVALAPEAEGGEPAAAAEGDYGEFVEILVDGGEAAPGSVSAPTPQATKQPLWMYGLLGLSVALVGVALAFVLFR